MNNCIEHQFGLMYRLRVPGLNGEVDQSSDWSHNLILNSAANYMLAGLNPTVMSSFRLGFSATTPLTSQTTVISPYAENVVQQIGYIESNAPEYTQVSAVNAIKTWFYTLTFKNISNGSITPKEIGIDNFSRSLIYGFNGAVNTASIPSDQTFFIDVKVIMNMTVPANINYTIKSLDGVTLGSKSATATITEPSYLVRAASWYDLFKVPKYHDAYIGILLTDGSYIWTNSNSLELTTSSINRQLKYILKISGKVTPLSVERIVLRFGSMSHQLNVIFSTPLIVDVSENKQLEFRLNW